jgi:hypothetical protein
LFCFSSTLLTSWSLKTVQLSFTYRNQILRLVYLL